MLPKTSTTNKTAAETARASDAIAEAPGRSSINARVELMELQMTELKDAVVNLTKSIERLSNGSTELSVEALSKGLTDLKLAPQARSTVSAPARDPRVDSQHGSAAMVTLDKLRHSRMAGFTMFSLVNVIDPENPLGISYDLVYDPVGSSKISSLFLAPLKTSDDIIRWKSSVKQMLLACGLTLNEMTGTSKKLDGQARLVIYAVKLKIIESLSSTLQELITNLDTREATPISLNQTVTTVLKLFTPIPFNTISLRKDILSLTLSLGMSNEEIDEFFIQANSIITKLEMNEHLNYDGASIIREFVSHWVSDEKTLLTFYSDYVNFTDHKEQDYFYLINNLKKYIQEASITRRALSQVFYASTPKQGKSSNKMARYKPTTRTKTKYRSSTRRQFDEYPTISKAKNLKNHSKKRQRRKWYSKYESDSDEANNAFAVDTFESSDSTSDSSELFRDAAGMQHSQSDKESEAGSDESITDPTTSAYIASFARHNH